ncbi:MAG: zinc ribbon domain-containing protein [Euryarchaeota archaeon]|nr:zinc ribbon domain-containing protein [Euryarchaeota archaeon]
MDPRKKVCSFCRLILPSDFQFCPMCGEPLTEEGSRYSPPYEPPPEEENPILLDRIGGALFSPTRKKIVIAVALVALVLVMGAGVVGVSMFQKPNSESSIAETATTTPSIAPTPTVYPTVYPTPTPTLYPAPYQTPIYGTPSPTITTPSITPSQNPYYPYYGPYGTPSPTISTPSQSPYYPYNASTQ